MEEDIKGKCFCESVRFSFLPPILFHVHCHCSYCRHAQGAAFVTWVGAEDETFRYITGGNLVTWYKSTEQSRRGFCATCGSTMFYKSILAPGEIHIARPYLSTHLEELPTSHVFYDQQADWISNWHDLPKYDGDNEVLSGYSEIPPKK